MRTVFVPQSRYPLFVGLLVAAIAGLAQSACNDQMEEACAQIEAAQPAS